MGQVGRGQRGRPPKIKDVDMPELMAAFEKYVDETAIPIVAEFAYRNGLWKQYFHERPEFANLVRRAISKKESALERGVLTGELNATMGVFSLKQLGWTDRQQLDMNIKQQSFEEQLQSLNQPKENDVIEH